MRVKDINRGKNCKTFEVNSDFYRKTQRLKAPTAICNTANCLLQTAYCPLPTANCSLLDIKPSRSKKDLKGLKYQLQTVTLQTAYCNTAYSPLLIYFAIKYSAQRSPSIAAETIPPA